VTWAIADRDRVLNVLTRTLFLHIGPAKTGTSAVQDVLSRHDNSVVLYPKAGLWRDASHHGLVFNFFQKYTRRGIVREDADSLFAKIAEEARNSQRDLVISSEVLAGRFNLNDFVSALQRHLDPEPFRVELVLVVREHFERAASAYNQRVKDADIRERRDPDRFLAEQIGGLGYAGLLRRLEQTGFDITILSYHPAGDCVARLLGHLGFALDQICETPRINPSLSRKALIAVLAGNRVAPTRKDRKSIVSALRRMPDFNAPSRMIFGREALASADHKIALDRNFLQKRYGVSFGAPNPAIAENAFLIDQKDVDDIADATCELGNLGAAVREEVRRYLRYAEGEIGV
jgi:hypothetical protein